VGARVAYVVAALLLVLATVAGCGSGEDAPVTDAPDGWGPPDTWTKPAETLPDPADFVEGVDNPWWPLVPGSIWVYEADTSNGLERIEVVVLDEVKKVAGIECMVVRDTVTLEGELIEDTYDWYAQDRAGNVWYMGEDSTEYEGGKAVSTSGSWEAGVDGALPGIKVWATPRIDGAPYYQEVYEGEAEDLARDIARGATVSVPFSDYSDVLVVEEWNKLNPETVERKYYAENVGVVMEEVTRGGSERVQLVKFTLP